MKYVFKGFDGPDYYSNRAYTIGKAYESRPVDENGDIKVVDDEGAQMFVEAKHFEETK